MISEILGNLQANQEVNDQWDLDHPDLQAWSIQKDFGEMR